MLKDLQKANTIITDASCFILLDKINCLAILHDLYGQVYTTPEYSKQLPLWVNVQIVKNRALLEMYAETVDTGEASAIALAQEVVSPSLILDDLKGRKLAKNLNLAYTGTIGMLILAKNYGLISYLKILFDKIEETNFRIPAELLQELLKKYHY